MIKVSKYYDKKPVLKDMSLSYFYGAKIGVLGLNGSGKSSLLRILAGIDPDFNGQTILSPGYTVGFLEQEPVLDDGKTVKEIVEQGVQATVDLLNEFNRINEQFAEPMSDEAMDKLIERQAEVQEKLEAQDAWELDSKLDMAMDALRCPPGDTRSRCCPGGKGGGWLFAGFCYKNRIFSFWMNLPIILMPNPLPGWKATFSGMPGPSLRLPMTDIS